MVTDQQVRRLMRRLSEGVPLSRAALQAGMDGKTARRYRRLGKLPSQCAAAHTWRTRGDPFADVWEEIRKRLEACAELQAKTLFEDLQRRFPGRFADGQLRTLQRRIRAWRACAGPPKEVFFAQVHVPGALCASDFTSMNDLHVTVDRQPFPHLYYHFVLTYSNWETGTVCVSESLESLTAGLQNALYELGGVPRQHRTDRLSAAVNNQCVPEEFTRRYQALLAHYGLEGQRIQAAHAHENGDVEQRHYRFKDAVNQALLLRGSRDFARRAEYEHFLRQLRQRLNAGRRARFAEERAQLRPLPARRLDDFRRERVTVGSGSTLRVHHNTYSVPSRLIGEQVEARLYAEHVEVWYGRQCLERFPRLPGRYGHRINYRHVIDWLVRKPGAFEQYRYREELFPSTLFRMAYDALRQSHAPSASRAYLRLLHLAARTGEAAVESVLRTLIGSDQPWSVEQVERLVRSPRTPPPPTDVHVAPVNLAAYDALCLTAPAEVTHA